jgi:hypothetical protein
MKSDDDNILTRRDQDEIEEEEDDDKNLNVGDLIIKEEPENSDSFNEGVNKD